MLGTAMLAMSASNKREELDKMTEKSAVDCLPVALEIVKNFTSVQCKKQVVRVVAMTAVELALEIRRRSAEAENE
jgi:hypothetical protein